MLIPSASSIVLLAPSAMGTLMLALCWSSGEATPSTMGPLSEFRRERSSSSRRGYIKRVRYAVLEGSGLLATGKVWFGRLAVLIGLALLALFLFRFPALEDGL